MACRAAGISDVTILRWRQRFPAFDQAVSDFLVHVREQRVVDSLYQLTQKATEDPKFASAGGRAGEFLLKAWNPNLFGEKITTSTTININHSVEIINSHRDELRAAQEARLHRITERKQPGALNEPVIDAEFVRMEKRDGEK
ncbi:hypothetical protein DKM44_14015 [Deinococcus irradiatisoli]|uniref:Uncharacterized protein n=2 Tax=Deinococcus irradiatisoli TaxID=2202254 RepID=A0A2Z3JGC8_9DEIO|nr:hypothetical protein DKM44_14015 [Deinococcus irradiatisoli]